MSVDWKIDMHFHSISSDWWSSNEQIMQEALKKWFYLAICTDHDFINKEFVELAREKWIQSYQWVEISCFDPEINKHFHLACYAQEFKWRIFDILEKSRNGRIEKIKAQVVLLRNNWFDIEYDKFVNFFQKLWVNTSNLNILHLCQ